MPRSSYYILHLLQRSAWFAEWEPSLAWDKERIANWRAERKLKIEEMNTAAYHQWCLQLWAKEPKKKSPQGRRRKAFPCDASRTMLGRWRRKTLPLSAGGRRAVPLPYGKALNREPPLCFRVTSTQTYVPKQYSWRRLLLWPPQVLTS